MAIMIEKYFFLLVNQLRFNEKPVALLSTLGGTKYARGYGDFLTAKFENKFPAIQ